MNEIPYEFIQGGGYFGPDFMAVFFFENIFWRVQIPLVFGENISVDTLASLITMPFDLKQRLAQNPRVRDVYKAHWNDCLHYSQDCCAFKMQASDNPAFELVTGADRDLRSAIADLSQNEPNSNAMHNARLALEKTLKAFLCFQHGFTVKKVAESFRHDLAKLAAEVVARDPDSDLALVQPNIANFAPYGDRYKNKEYSRPDLWISYQAAQFAGAALLHLLAGKFCAGAA